MDHRLALGRQPAQLIPGQGLLCFAHRLAEVQQPVNLVSRLADEPVHKRSTHRWAAQPLDLIAEVLLTLGACPACALVPGRCELGGW